MYLAISVFQPLKYHLHMSQSQLILLVLPLIARFMTFRNALNARIREANKLGVAQEREMGERK